MGDVSAVAEKETDQEDIGGSATPLCAIDDAVQPGRGYFSSASYL